ncbi:asparagine synthase-related protein [Pseudaeromonas sp. ZJS20]|uniref:asparagine synthase-related protein n=1 Tax=Pseudaeromonas aegiceratis TaxID=3153928 RepID=UPI00390CDA94
MHDTDRGHSLLLSNPVPILAEDALQQPDYQLGPWQMLAWARLDRPKQLADELGLDYPRSDAELLCQAWAAWGQAGIQRLYGSFALTAWHEPSRSLHLVVDHHGSQPLFYYQDEQVVLASPLRQVLLSHPAVPKQLNGLALAHLLVAKMTDEPWSAIQAVPGGHHLLLQAGQPPRLTRWWQPQAEPDLAYRDPRDYAAEAGALFAQAVKGLLRSRSGVASTLSGGLDSSLATTFAAEQLAEQGRTLHSFTSSPQDGDLSHVMRANWDLDEWPLTCELAKRHANLIHHRIRPDGSSLLDKLTRQHANSWNPLRNIANYHWLEQIYRQAAELDCPVLLTGARGNASLSYAGHGGQARLLPQGHWRWAWQHLMAHPVGSRLWLVQLADLLGVGKTLRQWRAPEQTADQAPPWLAHALLTRVDYHFPSNPFPLWADRVDFLTKSRPPYGLNTLWQQGVLSVDPFSDRALMEQLLRYPPEAYVGLGHQRLLARLVGEGRVPDSIRLRSRRGEQAPDESLWMREQANHYRAQWRQLRALPDLALLLDLDQVDRLLDSCTSEPVAKHQSFALHRILGTALFYAQARASWQADLTF